MKNAPIISVYIPTYNRSILLKRAVESVLNQTVEDIEIIIVDDNSTDDTEVIVRGLIELDPRVSYIKNRNNRGACYNRNIAISNAKGKFVTGLDDDDYFENDRLEQFLKAWDNKNQDTIALYDSTTIKSTETELEKLVLPEKVMLDDLYLRNDVGNQIFTKKELFSSGIKYDESLKSWQDLDLWICILSKNPEKCFENINCFSYVLDKSHPHERISSTNINKHIDSLAHIANKYDLSISNTSRLKCQAYSYNARSVEIIKLIKDSILTFSPYAMARMFKYYITNKKSM
ncbi:glycosyltransferase [Vibrio sp. NTOU-M3]|uniref:glycosyltransferase family 2 protein n=1 Tax=Vibrio sp. NTOU-M3 TaxID=3234954 RepID=UPI00349F5000